jgi:hypothetical protein
MEIQICSAERNPGGYSNVEGADWKPLHMYILCLWSSFRQIYRNLGRFSRYFQWIVDTVLMCLIHIAPYAHFGRYAASIQFDSGNIIE